MKVQVVDEGVRLEMLMRAFFRTVVINGSVVPELTGWTGGWLRGVRKWEHRESDRLYQIEYRPYTKSTLVRRDGAAILVVEDGDFALPLDPDR